LSFRHPRHWPTWIGLAILRLTGVLPLPVLALFGSAFGMLVCLLYASRRRIVLRNIERCFPALTAREHASLVRRHFRAFGQTLFSLPIAWWGSRRRLKRLVRLCGREHLAGLQAAGRPVILMAPHFLGLEIGGFRISMDVDVVAVFRHPDNPLLRAIMERSRARFGAQLAEHNKPFTSMVRTIKSGRPLYYLPDQDAGRRNSVFAPFFGVPASTFTTLARIAKMTGAAVIPCATYQRPWGMGYETVLGAPLAGYPTGDDVADATRMNAEIEKLVRVHPEQYFWVHKRFKTRPAGEADFYKR
jgi:KDO2-lipid IV(A) lauroyltransferase